MRSTTRWSDGFARIERLPSARAPNSMRPVQRATTPSETSNSAIRSSTRAGSLTAWRVARSHLRIAEVRRADRVRLVTARRKHEQLSHPLLGADQHVRLDVHEDAAAEGQPIAAVARVHEPRPAQQGVLEHTLGAGGDPVE